MGYEQAGSLNTVTRGERCEAANQEERRNNNFGVLRLCFALFVLFGHSYPLATGSDQGSPVFGGLVFGTVAVDGFFLISGYLITKSWIRSRSPSEFVIRRVLRIYPGYQIALLFSLAIGILASAPESRQYLVSVCYANDQMLGAVVFLDYGVLDQSQAFKTNPYPHVVNGSLWTLQPELKCYVGVLVLGVFGLVGRKRVGFLLLLLSYVIYTANCARLGDASHQMFRFSRSFCWVMCSERRGRPVSPKCATVGWMYWPHRVGCAVSNSVHSFVPSDVHLPCVRYCFSPRYARFKAVCEPRYFVRCVFVRIPDSTGCGTLVGSSRSGEFVLCGVAGHADPRVWQLAPCGTATDSTSKPTLWRQQSARVYANDV